VHGLWFEEAAAIGRVSAPGFFADPAWRRAWSAAVWTGDGPGSIDPMKEANAAEKRIDLEISTRADESLQYDGVPWKIKHRQRAREEAARRNDQTGKETASALPADVSHEQDPEDQQEDSNDPAKLSQTPLK